VVIDAELSGYSPSIFNVSDRAASRVRFSAPELQGDAGHLMASLCHKGGSDRGVDSPRHGNENFHDLEFATFAANFDRLGVAKLADRLNHGVGHPFDVVIHR